MQAKTRIPATLVMLLWALVSGMDPVDAPAAEATVTLRKSSWYRGNLLKLGDVADVESSNGFLARKLRDLDLQELPADAQLAPSGVRRQLVSARVALADLDGAHVAVRGPDIGLVSVPSDEDVEIRLVTQLRSAFAEKLRVAPDQLQVELDAPLDVAELLSTGVGQIDFRPRLHTTVRLGRQQVPVDFWDGSQRVRSLNIKAHITMLANVVATARDMEAGEVLAAVDLLEKQTWIDDLEEHAQVAELVGKALRQSHPRDTRLRTTDVRVSHAPETYLVNPRDKVQIIAQRGALRVIVMDGEVLQRGRQGDLVRVRNPKSKAILSARVVERGKVSVAF